MKKSCATCGRAATLNNRFCWGCEKKLRQEMAESGYLTDTSFILEEENRDSWRRGGPGTAGYRPEDWEGEKAEKTRNRKAPPFRQLCGELMKSGSKKGR